MLNTISERKRHLLTLLKQDLNTLEKICDTEHKQSKPVTVVHTTFYD